MPQAERAKRLLEILREVRNGGDSIPAQSIRAGDIVGEHTVIMAGPGERLELIHPRSESGDFRSRRLRAARWVIDQPAGLYRMENVLGL
jgi:4-hydroxy-tetrahydrodipicolinate reductase